MNINPPILPTTDPAASFRKPTVWPMVIGIIAIIIGSLGALQYVCGSGVSVMAGFIEEKMQDFAAAQPNPGMDVQTAPFKAMREHMPSTLAANCSAALLSVTLLMGGIGLVRRRCWSGRTLNIWAGLKMLHALPAAYAGYVMGQAMMEAMAEAAQASGAGVGQIPPGIFKFFASLGPLWMVIQILWWWALPVFMLIWFARRPIREEIASWRSESSTAHYLS